MNCETTRGKSAAIEMLNFIPHNSSSSFVSECLHRIDLRRAPRGEVAGEQGDSREQYRDTDERGGNGRPDTDAKCCQPSRQCDGHASPHKPSTTAQLETLLNAQANH